MKNLSFSAHRLLPVLGALLLSTSALAQNSPYSASPAYRQMLDELHTASPSPAFIATGRRPQPDPALKPEATETATTLAISAAGVRYTVSKTALRLTLEDLSTNSPWIITVPGCEAAGSSVTHTANVWTLTAAAPCAGARLELNVLSTGLARLSLTAPASAAQHLALHVEGSGPYLGFGERFWQAGLKGTHLDVRPQDRYGEPGHNWTYVAIPFVYSVHGLGLYADTAFDTRFAFNETGTAFDLELATHAAPLYLFTAPDPKGVLTAYTAMTGRQPDVPAWIFGPWITALQGKGPVLDMARRIRVEGMPASALWIYDELDDRNNLGWPFWFGSYYGDARSFTDTLHGLGFHVLTYVHPYVRQQDLPYTQPSPAYDKGVSEHLLQTDADGKPAGPRFEDVRTGNVDFTNPAAVDWWQGMITRAVHDQGFDGWMEDFGEWVRDTDRFAGGTGLTMSELYPLFYHKVTYEAADSANPDVVGFSRSGAPGSQAFTPVLWGADQFPNWSRDYGLPSVVTAGITAGESGFSTWGPDIMSAGDNRELWMRWVEFGALTPVMRDHVWNKPDRSFNIWTDAEDTALYRKYAVLHSSMLPYLMTYAAEAHRTGIPIMRHPALEYPSDLRSAEAEYEYLLGHEMLVAPVVEPGASLRKLYTPPGEWVNFWTGDSLTGGQDNTVPATTDTIPILVRAGSVLPLEPEAEVAHLDWSAANILNGPLVWRAFLSQTGETAGSFSLTDGTSAHLTQHAGKAFIDGESKTVRDYEVILRSRLVPEAVLLNGAPFPGLVKAANGKPAMQWWWNPSTSEVHMIFRAASFHLELDRITASQYQ